MIRFVIANAGGDIIRQGLCTAADLEHQAAAGETAIDTGDVEVPITTPPSWRVDLQSGQVVPA